MAFLKAIWRGNTKHKKLYDEWALASHPETDQISETLSEEVTFRVKYLGSTLVEKPSNEEATAEAVKTILTMAKASGKKSQRVSLTISLRGIKMLDVATEESQLEVSIYRISYCSADATHGSVFAFIATNENETMECHAFQCPKRKIAQAMSLAVAKTFDTAYEIWRRTQDKFSLHSTFQTKDANIQNKLMNDASMFSQDPPELRRKIMKEQLDNCSENEVKTMLIDFNTEPRTIDNFIEESTWVCFEDDSADNMNNYTRSNDKTIQSTTTTQHRRDMFDSSPFINRWEHIRTTNQVCS